MISPDAPTERMDAIVECRCVHAIEAAWRKFAEPENWTLPYLVHMREAVTWDVRGVIKFPATQGEAV